MDSYVLNSDDSEPGVRATVGQGARWPSSDDFSDDVKSYFRSNQGIPKMEEEISRANDENKNPFDYRNGSPIRRYRHDRDINQNYNSNYVTNSEIDEYSNWWGSEADDSPRSRQTRTRLYRNYARLAEQQGEIERVKRLTEDLTERLTEDANFQYLTSSQSVPTKSKPEESKTRKKVDDWPKPRPTLRSSSLKVPEAMKTSSRNVSHKHIKRGQGRQKLEERKAKQEALKQKKSNPFLLNTQVLMTLGKHGVDVSSFFGSNPDMTQREATLSLVKLANKIIELEGKAIATDQTKSEISRLDFDKKVSEAVDKKIKQEKDKFKNIITKSHNKNTELERQITRLKNDHQCAIQELKRKCDDTVNKTIEATKLEELEKQTDLKKQKEQAEIKIEELRERVKKRQGTIISLREQIEEMKCNSVVPDQDGDKTKQSRSPDDIAEIKDLKKRVNSAMELVDVRFQKQTIAETKYDSLKERLKVVESEKEKGTVEQKQLSKKLSRANNEVASLGRKNSELEDQIANVMLKLPQPILKRTTAVQTVPVTTSTPQSGPQSGSQMPRKQDKQLQRYAVEMEKIEFEILANAAKLKAVASKMRSSTESPAQCDHQHLFLENERLLDENAELQATVNSLMPLPTKCEATQTRDDEFLEDIPTASSIETKYNAIKQRYDNLHMQVILSDQYYKLETTDVDSGNETTSYPELKHLK